MIRLAGSALKPLLDHSPDHGELGVKLALPRSGSSHELAEDCVRRESLARLGPGTRCAVDGEALEEAGEGHRSLRLAEGEPVAELHQFCLD